MLKPFVTYMDFATSEITEIAGDVRLSQIKVEYHDNRWDEALGMFVPTVSTEDRIKVTLYPCADGSRVTFMAKGNNGEGNYTRYESIAQSTDNELNDVWLIGSGEYGRDCDGAYSNHFDGISDGSADPDYSNKYFPTMFDMSVVRELGNELRDYAAEAAGY